MLIASWFSVGFVGLLLTWRLWTLTDKPFQRCPTPRALAACAAFSFLGLGTMILAVSCGIGTLVAWLTDKPTGASWWTRPLCK